jgi:hypothetical protein
MAAKNMTEYAITVSIDPASSRLVKAQAKALLRAHDGVMAAIRGPGKKPLELAARELYCVASLALGKVSVRLLGQTLTTVERRKPLLSRVAKHRKARVHDQPKQVASQGFGGVDHEVHAEHTTTVAALDTRDVAFAASDLFFQLALAHPASLAAVTNAGGYLAGQGRLANSFEAPGFPRLQVGIEGVGISEDWHVASLRT